MITGIGFYDAKFRRRVKKATVYIARATDDGRIKESGPCIDCLTALRMFGIKNMVFTTDGGMEIHNIQLYSKIYTSCGKRHLINRAGINKKKKRCNCNHNNNRCCQ